MAYMPQLPPPPAIPNPVPFLECRLHPVTTRQFAELLARAAKEARNARPPREGKDAESAEPANRRDKDTEPADRGDRGAAKPLLATYLNAHCSNLAADNAAYRRALGRFHVVYADGQGVVWASRALGAPVPERVNAGDFILDFCRRCAQEKLRVFLLGSYAGVAEKAARAWREAAPELGIAGVRDGFFSEDDEEALAAEINAARPDILLVGMGAPRQELWVERWAARLDAPVIWCVGALFEYFSGARRRAPAWMRRAGLEWLFRLALEPGRLWRRYLVGNIRFVRRVLAAKKAPRSSS